ATYKVAPEAFIELGADVDIIHNQPDGLNINDNCGSQHTQDLRKRVVDTGSDIGLAFDGDGDRLIAVDEKGGIVSGDEVIAVLADFLKEKRKLKNNYIVGTVMSNFGLRKYCEKKNIKIRMTRVGDKYVLEEMQKLGAIIGGEDSGHVIMLDHHTTGDGILTALQLISVMRQKKKKLSVLRKVMKRYPQVLINVPVGKRADFKKVPELKKAYDEASVKLKNRGRVLIRYSGTQLLLRIMVEGPSHKEISKIAEDLAKLFKKKLS
ncbi:MAG: phosphoglucosamine mutase, partial [Victivallaceae bacterium]|nr:phosphoglucosamine mutase [Victivallaceae bacterium]